ncbi:MAG: EutN/CcmL family microcompartment protein [Candidatus Eisenbacteria bacterium]|nr:EutN/CcmL family microcompartment protein [Candidatus Eisenbacteria bacterium]
MIIGRVIGEIYSTINHPILDHRKLLIVEKLSPTGRALDDYLVAIDTVDAGVGQTVLAIDEGNSARLVLRAPNAPTRSIVVGIIDAIEMMSEAAGPAGHDSDAARPEIARPAAHDSDAAMRNQRKAKGSS